MEVPFGYCHCGCGQKTKIAKRTYIQKQIAAGVPLRYIAGHQNAGRIPSQSTLDKRRSSMRTHGHSSYRVHTSTYRIWTQMKQRCLNTKNHEYKNYGARGITVCERWREFPNFLADMGERPLGLSIERRDNDSGYSPSNCYWATSIEQANNKRTNAMVEFRGKTYTRRQLAKLVNINEATLRSRTVRGMSVEEAVSAPLNFWGKYADRRVAGLSR